MVSEPDISQLLSQTHTIAAVGLSDNPRDETYEVGMYLQSQGYNVIPVNPGIGVSVGRKAFPSIREVPGSIDLVHIIKGGKNVDEAINEALQVGAKAIWLEPGVEAPASLRTQPSGIPIVKGKQFKTEHQRLLSDGPMHDALIQ